MLAVPEFGGLGCQKIPPSTVLICDTHNEDVLTLEASDVLESTFHTFADFTLVLVDDGQVQVTVAGLESLVDSLTDLTRGRLPGTETQLTATLVHSTMDTQGRERRLTGFQHRS